MKNVIGLLDCHHSPELGELTRSRPLASTSFLGRYAFCDFALSNFCNSEIDNVGILVKNHQRSILKHMGSMMSWVTNTKVGHETIFFNEKGALNQDYNTDINNILENDWVLYDSNASYIVFQSAHIIANLDFRPMLEEHIARGEKITVVYKKIDNADRSFRTSHVFDIDEDGYVVGSHNNDGSQKEANVSLEAWIINREVLAEVIHRHGEVRASWGMREVLAWLCSIGAFKMHTYEFKGYARCFDSLEHYVEYSYELLDRDVAKELFLPDWPIYTQTHDTPPALYGEEADVRNSFISNGCIVNGEVTDSILCRGVKVGKGAVIKRAIVLSQVSIGDNAKIGDIVVDKYAVITANHVVKGDPYNIIYLKQGAII